MKPGDLVEVHYLDLASECAGHHRNAELMTARCPGYFVAYRKFHGVRTLVLADLQPDGDDWEHSGWHAIPANLVLEIHRLKRIK